MCLFSLSSCLSLGDYPYLKSEVKTKQSSPSTAVQFALKKENPAKTPRSPKKMKIIPLQLSAQVKNDHTTDESEHEDEFDDCLCEQCELDSTWLKTSKGSTTN